MTITPDATTLTITPSVPAPVAGQDVTFMASVTDPAGRPVTVGSVQFQVDGQDFGGPVTLDAQGQATIDPGALPAGSLTINAVYSGSLDYQGSHNSLTEVAGQFATHTTLDSSEQIATQGDTVVFTATVTGIGAGAGTPSGSVQFEVDGQPSGSPMDLDSKGTATLSLSTLDVGVRTITAVYGGQTPTFGSSTGSTTIVVKDGQTITFGPISGVTLGTKPITLLASASSGLAVTFFGHLRPGHSERLDPDDHRCRDDRHRGRPGRRCQLPVGRSGQGDALRREGHADAEHHPCGRHPGWLALACHGHRRRGRAGR